MISLSIICCVYNEEKYLESLLQSILGSMPNFIDWELRIIDDFSTDNTYSIAAAFSDKYKNIFLERNNFKGKVDGTIQGFMSSSKTWVKFVDGDDFLDLSKLDESDFECDAFYHDYSRFNNKGSKVVKTPKAIEREPNSWAFNLRSIPKAMFFCKKSILFDIADFRDCIFEDLFINQLIMRRASQIVKVPKVVYHYRQHDGNYYGDSFWGNRQKVLKLASRLENTIPIIQNKFGSNAVNHRMETYISLLRKFSFKEAIKLSSQPHLFFKFLFYRLISLKNFDEI